MDIETALVVLADEFGLYLYRTDVGWVVTNEYRYRSDLRGGSPRSHGTGTIREAIDEAIRGIREEADLIETEARHSLDEAARLRKLMTV